MGETPKPPLRLIGDIDAMGADRTLPHLRRDENMSNTKAPNEQLEEQIAPTHGVPGHPHPPEEKWIGPKQDDPGHPPHPQEKWIGPKQDDPGHPPHPQEKWIG